MNHDSGGNGAWTAPMRARRPGFPAAILAAILTPGVVLLAAACGSGNRGGGAAPSSSGSASHYQQALAYSQCMRTHGVPSFPDPDSQGNYHNAPGPETPGFTAAANACRNLAPSGQLSAAQQQQVLARALKFSQCMRSHGVIDFSDPTMQDGVVNLGMPGSAAELKTRTFQSAQQICARLYMPGQPGKSPSPGHE
jgi:hypothetical protein